MEKIRDSVDDDKKYIHFYVPSLHESTAVNKSFFKIRQQQQKNTQTVPLKWKWFTIIW